MIDEKRLQDFKESGFAKVVIEYLEGEIKNMQDLDKHTSWEDVKGKQYASKILKNLCRFLSNKEEKVVKSKYN
jgi:uncharacterized protein (UPF0335 family)